MVSCGRLVIGLRRLAAGPVSPESELSSPMETIGMLYDVEDLFQAIPLPIYW
jgi:hypothetical protein